ncbi:hypothetical protein ACJJTC_010524 [Scirpophaga incertulas]
MLRLLAKKLLITLCQGVPTGLVNQESAPYQTNEQSETSQAEQNQSDQQTHTLEPAENLVCQDPMTSQPANVPTCVKSDNTFVLNSPKQLFSLLLTKKSSRVAKKRGKTAIITSSPYKKELEVIVQKKKDAEQKKLEKIGTKKIYEFKKQKKTKYQNKKQSRIADQRKQQNYEESHHLKMKEKKRRTHHAHNSCARIDDDDDEVTHICEYCQCK